MATYINENKVCKNCQSSFEVDASDFGFYEKIGVPSPTFCPNCRKQRRLAWRNDLTLYSRKCDLCQKSIVSIYSPESGLTVYCQKCWWGDGWDPYAYGVDYDFDRSFFEQYRELQQNVPVLAMVNDNGIASVNSEYTHDYAFGKNCYMVFIAWKVEECMYSYYIISGKEIMDSLNSWGECERVYETINTEKLYNSRFCYSSVALSDSAFCYDCRDSSDCFMCVGLRHKRYCFKNQQLTKEEYEKVLKEYKLNTYSGVNRALREFEPMLYQHPRRFATMRNCVGCTGDMLINGKNSKHCFGVQRPEDDKWVENADSPRQSYDLSTGGELEQCYEGITPDHSYHGRFAIFSWKNNEVDYVDGCHSSSNLFGCAGLKKAEYCIFNKRYSKEEYGVLRAKIVEQMNHNPYEDKRGIKYSYGEFYPTELSYFRYNESIAQDYFPLTKGEVQENGWQWQDNLQMTTGKETIKPEDIPDAIEDVPENILEAILMCVKCQRNYKIVPAELAFYRKIGTPVPRKCFYCRNAERLKMRNPYKLWQRTCQCTGRKFQTSNSKLQTEYSNTAEHFHGDKPCPNTFETPYAPERPEIVYCEQCYNAEIV